jgi:putative transposase
MKLQCTAEQKAALADVRSEFARVCNLAGLIAQESGCYNRVALHHAAYYRLKAQSKLGAQLTCQAIARVCDAYRVLKAKRVKMARFNSGSVPYDARTYRLVGETLSLYTMRGRIKLPLSIGEHQRRYADLGKPREGKLVLRSGAWFFNLAVEVPDVQPRVGEPVGVDVGENNLAALSTGKIFSGKQLCFERDKHLALRSRLQANGTQSSKQLLCKVSGREQRRVKHVNHVISKAIVAEAVASGSGIVAMEDLTHIRQRIQCGKRVRARLHRWAWRQLQDFVHYKAEQAGLTVIFVNPAYTSKTCAACLCLGNRQGSLFSCTCGNRRHADVNAASNIRRLAGPIGPGTGAVTTRHVAFDAAWAVTIDHNGALSS